MKHRVRQQMRSILAEMSPEVASAKSLRACELLLELDEFRQAGVVMIYLGIPNEVDAQTVALAAWQGDKTVLTPKVTWDSKQMVATRIHSLDSGLIKTPQGLREPAEGDPWAPEEIDFIVVPALAYDRAGNRLGRGGGFYDRFLQSPGMHAVTCGLAFSEQVVAEFPVHANDYPVDILVTDQEVLRFEARAPAVPPAPAGQWQEE